MLVKIFLGLALAAAAPSEPPFPLRTDPSPAEWRTEEINAGLPLSWEPGSVHLLAWETVADDRPVQYTQVLVLKQFDRPTEDGGHRWVLAHLYHDPEHPERLWQGPLRVPPPYLKGEPVPELTDAQVYGWGFYNAPPTDDEIKTFLRDTSWTPDFDADRSPPGKSWLAAGGVNRAVWKEVLGRDVPTQLFPELQKSARTKG
jgi:hypothetical protein